MRIAIISDSHDNRLNLIKALTFIKNKKVGALIHCGDVCFGGTFEILVKNFLGEIYLVLGNGDDQKYFFKFLSNNKNLKIKIFQQIGEFSLGGIKMAMTHFPDRALKLAKESKYEFVFYGHTHKPWLEKVGDTILLNPGNLAGLIYQPTFALGDFNGFELINLNNH